MIKIRDIVIEIEATQTGAKVWGYAPDKKELDCQEPLYFQSIKHGDDYEQRLRQAIEHVVTTCTTLLEASADQQNITERVKQELERGV